MVSGCYYSAQQHQLNYKHTSSRFTMHFIGIIDISLPLNSTDDNPTIPREYLRPESHDINPDNNSSQQYPITNILFGFTQLAPFRPLLLAFCHQFLSD